MNNGVINKEKAWELIHTDDFKIEDFVEMASEVNVAAVRYYTKAFEDSKSAAIAIMNKTRDLQNNGLSRKDISMQIKNDKFAYFGFKAIDSADTPETIISNTETKKFLNFVENYAVK